ncbi:MAG: hypothetical protein IJX81_00160 [Clostridia bacterium]|nr:hypothetical protein [Clostridia bacterium]
MSRKTATIVKKKGGILGKLVALLLGFILGFVSAIGGLVGGVYFLVSSVKIKDAVNGVSSMTGQNIDYTQYITEEYAEKTVLGLVGSLGEVAQEFSAGTGSLATLEKISPYVRTAIEQLASQTANYGVPLDVETLMVTPFGELAAFMQSTINSIELGPVIKTATGQMSSLLMLICYGEEGVHYEMNGEEVVMLGECKPVTVGQLTNDAEFKNVLGRITLASLVQSAGSVNPDDAIMRTLLYGTKGVDYEIVNGEIVMRPIAFTYDSGLDAWANDEGVPYLKDGDAWVNEAGDRISANTVQPTSTSGNEYDYVVADKDGNVLYQLKKNDAQSVYFAYLSGIQQTHQGLTLGDFLGGEQEISEIFEGVYLGDLLGLDANSDKIMLSLAYGEQGVDYEVNGTEIVPITTPTSLGALMGGDMSGILEKVKLYSLLQNVSPLDENANPMLVALCYGEEGVHYEIVDGEIEWKTDEEGNPYAARSIKDLMDDPNAILNEMTLSGLLGISPLDDPKPNNILLMLCYGEEGVHYEIVDGEIEWKTDEATGEKYRPRTIFDLTEDPNSLIDGMTLGSLLGVSPLDDPKADPLLLVLAYGEEGVHYEIVEESGEKKIEWLINKETGEKYAPRTLLELTQDPNALLNGVSLAAALSVTAESDAIMLQLAYGPDNRYTISGETIEMNPVVYDLVGGVAYDDKQEEVGAATFVKEVDGEQIFALANGEYIRGTEEAGYFVYLTQEAAESGDEDERVLYKKTTLADLRGDEATSIIESIELGAALGVAIDSTDKLMVAFAYGYEGVHFELDGSGEPTWKTNPATGLPYQARTIKDMKNATAIINDIRLETALEIGESSPAILKAIAYDEDGAPRTIGDLKGNPDALINGIELYTIMTNVDKEDTLMMFLLYGEKDIHYSIDADGVVTMLQMQIAILGDKAYDVYGEELNATVETVTGGYQVTVDETVYYLSESHRVQSGGADKTVEIGEQQAPLYYAFLDGALTLPAKYEPRTLGEFTNGGEVLDDLMNSLTIGSLIGNDGDSKIMQAIGGWKMKDLQSQTKINSLKLSDVMTVNEGSPKVLQAIGGKTIGELQDSDTFDNLYIYELIEVKEDSPTFLKAIQGWQLKDMQSQTEFNKLQLGQIIEIIEYPKEGETKSPAILIAMKDWKISDMQDQDKFNGLKIESLIPIDESSSPILQAMKVKGWTVGTLQSQDAINGLTLEEVLGKEKIADSKFLNTLGDTKIGNLSEAIDGLSLTNLFGEDIFRTIKINGKTYYAYTNRDAGGKEILYHLYEKTENGETKYYLENTFQTEISVAKTHIRQVPFYNNGGTMTRLYYADGIYYLDGDLTQDSGFRKGDAEVVIYPMTALNRLYEKEVTETVGEEEVTKTKYFADEACTIEKQRELEGAWHYMLMDPVSGEVEDEPTIGHMSDMMTNMQENIRKATLNELEEDGIIQFGEGEDKITEMKLKTHIVIGQDPITGDDIAIDIGTPTSSYYGKSYIGELSVMQMLDYIRDIFAAINDVESILSGNILTP